jgi:hypothetical protein
MPQQSHRPRSATQRTETSPTSSSTNAGQGNQAAIRQMSAQQNPGHFAKAMPHGAFENTGLRRAVFGKALGAFELAYTEGRSESPVVTIIDYELPSRMKRLWVIDLEAKRLLYNEYVTHGQGSDRNHDGVMDSASNKDSSHQSNVGLLTTAETYYGSHGKSLKMDGQEAQFNDNARDRHIVFHGASYADDSFVEANGKTGRSHGCPALDPDVSGEIIETIKGGKLVFAYWPDPQWLEQSRFLNPSD